jgi:hypothetical protein
MLVQVDIKRSSDSGEHNPLELGPNIPLTL